MSVNLTIQELKQNASLVSLLDRLGYKPVPGRGRETMYLSMLRDDDRTPSFSVNDRLGVWFDHGTGKGGNIIDFGIAYWKQLSFSQVVQKLCEVLTLEVSPEQKVQRPRKPVKIPNYIVHQVKPLGTHPAITEYLESRGVYDAAKQHLSEVYYYVEDDKGNRKKYFSAGWQNENKAWEVRNRYFKGCMGPKSITYLPGHPKNVVVFEGFLDFLSWKTEHPGADHSIIVLNSVAMLLQGINKAKAFSSIDLYFDRDKTGNQATKDFIKALPYATDRSKIYEGYNDYNDKIKQLQKQSRKAVPADFFTGIKVPFQR